MGLTFTNATTFAVIYLFGHSPFNLNSTEGWISSIGVGHGYEMVRNNKNFHEDKAIEDWFSKDVILARRLG